MDLEWMNFFSAEKLPLLLTDAASFIDGRLFIGTANHRWSQEVNFAAPLLAGQVQNKNNKFIFVPGVNNVMGGSGAQDMSFDDLNTLAGIFQQANPNKQVVYCSSAGTEVCLNSLSQAKADLYVFNSPRVSRETFMQMIQDAGLRPGQVLVTTAARDYQHYPTDFISNPQDILFNTGLGGSNIVPTAGATIDEISRLWHDSFFDYEHNRNGQGNLIYNYLFLNEDLSAGNGIPVLLSHGGAIDGAVANHQYTITYNGETQTIFLPEQYVIFINGSDQDD